MSFSIANQSIGPADGRSIGIAPPAGGVIDSIAYHKTGEADSIIRIELASVAFHKLTDLDEVAYSFLVKGKKANGDALSTSLSGSPVSAPDAPVVISCVGLETSLSATIEVAEDGDLLFFLIDAAGAILEISKPSQEAGTYELLLSDGLVEGGFYEVSVMLKVARGFSSVSNTKTITLSNIPDGISVESQDNHQVDGQDIHLTLAVAEPDDYAADFKLEAEVTTAKEWTEEELIAISSTTVLTDFGKEYRRAQDSESIRFGKANAAQPGATEMYFRDVDTADFDPIGKTAYKYQQAPGAVPVISKLGQIILFNGISYTLSEAIQVGTVASDIIFIIDDMEVTTEVKQVTPDAVDQKYLVGASLVIASLGDFASVKLRWTNDQGSSAYSSAFLMQYSKTDPLEHARNNLKVTPSIADKVLSFAVSARDGALGLKSASYVLGGVTKTHQVNATDGRIVKSMPADQDLSAISASQAISAELAYETGADAQFAAQLKIPRIEAGQVSIQAKEVLSADGGKVEFDFTDSSSYIDGASRTSVTINETPISQQDFIPANASGSTDFQLSSVQFSLPVASIAATDSMAALSGIADWQSMPIKQVEVFGKDLALDGPTAVGDFFINFDLSVKLDGGAWVEKDDTEKDATMAQLNAAYGAKVWYSLLTSRGELADVPLKYEDGELYFVELTGSSWKMYYKSGDIERINMQGDVLDGQLELPVLAGKKIWLTTTHYGGQQAPVPLAADIASFPARKFILDRTVQTHTAVSPPTAATLVISADGNEGKVIGEITPGSTGNQVLLSRTVFYNNGTETTQAPYAVFAGAGVIVKGMVEDKYQYTKADGSIHEHTVLSLESNEAHGTTAPILGTVTVQGKQLIIRYKSGGKLDGLSLFVFAIDHDVSQADVTSGRGSFHEIKSITPQSLTAEVSYTADFSHFSSSIKHYMIALSRAADGSAATIDGM